MHRGQKLSPELCAKLSAAHKGKPLSEEHKRRISEANKRSPRVRRGASHPCWSGGPGDERSPTPESRAWRDAVLERDDWTCQDCHVRFGKQSRRRLHAHHIRDWVHYPDLRAVVANGVTLCHPCHWKRHGYRARGPEVKACDCGCGREMVAYDSQGRLRHYLRNHSPKYRASRSHPLSEETRRRIGESNKRTFARDGRPPVSDATRAKLSAAFKGKPQRAEDVASRVKSRRENPNIHHPASKVYKLSDETRRRMGEGMKRSWAEGRHARSHKPSEST